MGTNYLAPTWRMPENTNKDKLSNYSIDTAGTSVGIDCGSMADIFGTASVTYNTSYSIWIKPEFNYNDAGYQTFFGNFSTGNNALLLYYATDIDAWKFAVGDGNGHNYVSSATITSNEELGKGEWQHHCVVFDTINNDAYYYINNQLVNDGTGGSTGTNLTRKIATNANFYIGKKWDLAAGTFTGQISQGCIFDYALSTDQRTYLYNLNNPMAITGVEPIAYWPLGDNSNPNATAGYPNISVGADSVFDFDASNQYINLNATLTKLSVTDTFSFSTWAKTDSPTAWAHVVGGTSSGSWSDGFGLFMRSFGGIKWSFWVNQWNGNFVDSTDNIVTDQWYHIVCTYSDSSGGKMYINNGTPVTFGATTLDGQGEDIDIGTIGNSAGYDFPGEITNTQFWNVELSSSDVSTLYNNGQPLMTGTQPQNANLRAWYKLNQSANWEADTALNWQIPDNRSAYPQSFEFRSPVVEQIDLGSNLNFTSAMTFTAWVKVDTTHHINDSLTFASNVNGVSNTKYVFRYYQASGNKFLRLQIWANNGVVKNYNTYANNNGAPDYPDISDNNWHLVGFSCDGTTDADGIRMYVDEQAWYFTADNPGIQSSTLDTRLGVYLGNNPTWDFAGEMSNAQFWDTNLSDANIVTLYNNGIPLTTAIETANLKAWYKLDNTEVWSADNTYYTTDRWNIDNNKYPSDFKTALEFSSNEYISVDLDGTGGSSSVIGSGGNLDLTFSYWVNPNYQNSRGSFKWGESAGNGANWFINITHGRFPNKWIINIDNNTTSRIQYDVPKTDVWYLLVVTRTASDNTWRMYANDTFVGSYDDGGTFTAQNYATKVFLGSGRLNSFEGFLSNAYIWNSSLSDSDKTLLYNNGRPLSDLSGLSAQPFSWWKLDNKTTGIKDSIGSNNGTITGGRVANSIVSTQAAYSLGMTAQNLVNNNVSALNGESSGMDTTNLVQSNLTRKQPYSSYSIEWDAGTDYMDLPASTWTGGEEYTISVWGRKDSFGNDFNGTPLVWAQGTSNDYRNVVMWWQNATTLVFSNGQELNSTKKFTSTFNDEWYHFCFVATLPSSASPASTDLKIYLNGVEQSLSAPSSYISAPQAHSAFGRLPNNTGFNYNGKMSNVAIFESKLNQDDVLNLYNNGVTQDLNNFRITPKHWWPLDGKYTYFNGTSLVGRDVINNMDATGNNLVQQDIIGDAPGSTSSGTGSNLTIADLKGDMKSSINNSYSINMADYADGVTNPANSGRSTNVP